MKKIITISKYFFRKNIKDIFFFSIILFIATTLFSSSMVLNNNINKDYDEEFDRLNTASSFFTIPKSEYKGSLLDDIRNIKDVIDVEGQKGIMLSVPVNMDGSVQEQNQIFYNVRTSCKTNKREIIYETNESIEHGIYLSNYTFIHSGLNLKDKYEVKLDDTTYSFYVKGIVNEMQYGNYTSSVIGEYLESDAYEYLLENNKDKEVVTIAVKSSESESTYKEISKYLSDSKINVLNRNYKENAKNQRLAISNILVLVLIVFSGIILIISLFVSKFKIKQTIEEEVANMGALEALGYTSREIIISNIFPYAISGLIFTILGIVTSYFMLPILSSVVEMQSGFIWKTKNDLLSNIIVLIINLSLIIIFTLAASLKIKRINPINAIRGLIENKKSKNYFEIEKSRGNIHFILSLKNFMNTKKQNILLGIVLCLITIVGSFIGILFYNINMNPINFIDTLVEEHPSVVISVNQDLKNEIKKQDNVKEALYYDENAMLSYKDSYYKTFVADSFDNLANDLCYKGCNPKNGNEIAVGSKIKEQYNINIGDNITLNKNGTENEYKVVGFIQSVNYSGEVIELTLDGYKKIDSSYVPSTIYVYLENEDLSEEFINKMKEKYESHITSTINYAESMDSAMNMYVSLIKIVAIVMIIITALLIYLILYIIISSIITRRKQELGIFKAIGYENKQLVKQIVGGFIPSTLLGAILGLVVDKISMSNIYSTIFKSVGAYKVSFEYPLIVFIIIAVLLILCTTILATMLARKIKKISVYALIKD